VKWTVHGKAVMVRQTTRFPEQATTEFTVSTPQPIEFTLKLRNPQWLASRMRAALNGQDVPLTVGPLHWATVRREWRDGEKLRVILPMRLTASSFDAPRPYPAALLYGPVVLAFQTTNHFALEKMDLAQPNLSLTPVAGELLTWQLNADRSVRARPFYAYREGEPYYLYFDPNDGKDPADQRVQYKARWGQSKNSRFSNSVGAIARYTFYGTGIRWLGAKFDNAGRAEVTIDGKVVGVVDQYGPGIALPFDWSIKDLKLGRHTIQLRVLEEKLPESKDRFVNIGGFRVISGENQ
jgi:hypothetical protein